MKGIFVFRRDLRLEDNEALNHALTECEEVLPIFIFDPKQIKEHEYKSSNALQFMIESLIDLDDELRKKGSKLHFYEGDPYAVLKELLNTYEVIYYNRDYTPYSKLRDKKINTFNVKSFDGLLLHKPGTITSNGKPYTIFTPFYKKAIQFFISEPVTNKGKYANQKNDYDVRKHYKENKQIAVRGGRKNGLKILKKISDFKDYKEERDFPFKEKTTKLSAHLKFGTISPREFYDYVNKHLGINHDLIRQLYWREFYTHIAYFFPRVFGNNFQQKYDYVKWAENDSGFKNWCEGKTGFPIIDAGIRELNTTGYVHNRVRMIVASFLTKDLRIDWRRGEKYFATKLVDYDPCVNNGSWQWAASTGCDAQPYFRIFNPWLQQKKFDPDCEYIKKWIPELKDYSNKTIHAWSEANIICDYPKPMLDHFEEKEKALLLFKLEPRN